MVFQISPFWFLSVEKHTLLPKVGIEWDPWKIAAQQNDTAEQRWAAEKALNKKIAEGSGSFYGHWFFWS